MTLNDRIPNAALILGGGGLIPFVLGASGLISGLSVPLLGGGSGLRLMLVVYAVAILSFLGGVRWGIALGYDDPEKATRDYVIAVIPALVGWGAAALPAPADLWVLCIAFILLGLLDYGLICREVAPYWYGRFRLALSAVAALCLGVAAVA